MKTASSILIVLLTAIVALASPHEETYLKAQEAYDEARYAEAALLYEELLSHGVANVEVYYNLANANFKDSDLPQAVRYYRQAWYKAPRDPDIKANLHFALNAAGAIDPAPTFAQRTLYALSYSEWIIAATAGYLILILLLILCQLIPSARRFLLKTALVPLALIAASGGGWWQWQQLKSNPEWVVVKSEATALYGPVEGSTAHYKLPLGALARQRGIDPKGWVEVEYDGKRGWLKAEYISRVSP